MVLPHVFSPSLVVYQSLLHNSRLQLLNHCLVAGIAPISFTMVTSGIKAGGPGAEIGPAFHRQPLKLTKINLL